MAAAVPAAGVTVTKYSLRERPASGRFKHGQEGSGANDGMDRHIAIMAR
jgi:hypothetical protein